MLLRLPWPKMTKCLPSDILDTYKSNYCFSFNPAVKTIPFKKGLRCRVLASPERRYHRFVIEILFA